MVERPARARPGFGDAARDRAVGRRSGRAGARRPGSDLQRGVGWGVPSQQNRVPDAAVARCRRAQHRLGPGCREWHRAERTLGATGADAPSARRTGRATDPAARIADLVIRHLWIPAAACLLLAWPALA